MVYEIIEKAKKTGKIRKGANEVTKAIEREEAKLVVVAKDVSPPEVIQHIPVLCKEKGIPYIEVDSKQKLGAAAGLNVPTATIAITKEGEAQGEIDKLIKEATKHQGQKAEKAKPEEKA